MKLKLMRNKVEHQMRVAFQTMLSTHAIQCPHVRQESQLLHDLCVDWLEMESRLRQLAAAMKGLPDEKGKEKP